MLRSLLITCSIGVGFGLVGLFTGGDFLRWFGISFVSQFVLFFIFNSLSKSFFQLQINRLEVERINAMEKNNVEINCALCNEINEIVVNVAEINEFRCVKCNSLNTVRTEISNYHKTEIIPNSGIITEDVLNKIKKDLDVSEGN